ncbi:MAG: DNA-binding response regulator [Spirochaetaceae bacterium]|nr:DNA-binding response regulator [Spirochaetaceae bacterium]|tara:strand:+ start:62218 stop:62913 length:696 start_codon:yes stop_codon:yes gene_type:complete
MAENYTATILLVEDEPFLRKGIRLNLEAEGFRVIEYEKADDVLDRQNSFAEIALGIFDIMLPGQTDGLELCKKIRSRSDFPVIFLTARSGLDDKLEAFQAGADDYITKPFELEELLVRVQARLRNRVSVAASETIGAFRLDLDSGMATSQSGEVVRFNDREKKILQLLLLNRGRPVHRSDILDHAWSSAESPTNRTVDNYIVKFRKVFEEDPAHPRWFITRHGQGYELALP